MDLELLLIIIPILLVFGSQAYVKNVYKNYKLIKTSTGITGFEAARLILESNGIDNIKVVTIAGELSDHFDPRNNVVRLSNDVYNGSSIAAVSIAAHEIGHVIQHNTKYRPIMIRSKLVPIINFTSKIGYIMLIIGLLSELLNLFFIGLILLSLGLIFQLVTLPVEFNASKRAKENLLKNNIVTNNEIGRVNTVLGAAAITYVASFLASILQVARLFIRYGRRN